MELTNKELFNDAIDHGYFPNCIECSEHYAEMTQHNFFHKEGCSCGANINWDIISKRIDERILVLREHIKKNKKNKSKCRDCDNDADGMGWVRYHSSKTIVESFPLCHIHSDFNDHTGRPQGFLPGATKLTPRQIQKTLKDKKHYDN